MTKLEIGLGVLVLLLAGFVGIDQYHKAVGNAVAEESAKIQKAADDKIKAMLKERDDQYQKEHAQDAQAVSDARKSVSTMAAFANSKVDAPSPIVVHTGPLETVTLHTGDAVIPAESSTAFFDAFANGNTCVSLDYPKCKADLIDWQARYDTKAKEAANWEKAAKGGSWLKRLGRDVIRVGIGVGIGYALKH